MTTTENPQQARALERRVLDAVKTWLDILDKTGHGSPTPADVDHSGLLYRLLNGKPPLPEPPPRSFSYPWYSLIENGEETAQGREVDQKYFVVNQARWDIVSQDGDNYVILWPETGLRCRATKNPGTDEWNNYTITVIKDN